jgi:threonine dehydrogenase-like Zn-dependent dehydrogenase
MKALTVAPGTPDTAAVEEVPDPSRGPGDVLVEGVAVGVCGTDGEILSGRYGWAPPGRDRLVLGHESLGRVVQAPEGSPLRAGQLVVGIVRRPDPVPCSACAVGQWDMCRNGQYTERGIKERDGYCSERWTVEEEFCVPVDQSLGLLGVLLEPTSVVAKAWDHIERIGSRAAWSPSRVLVTGAGPIGLLAAMIGRQHGLAVDVVDRVSDGPKPQLVADLGASYHTGDVVELAKGADIAIECTGVGQLVLDLMEQTRPGGVVCLTGVSSGGRTLPVDAGLLNRTMVLENDVVFGSVNANRHHYELAAEALAAADRDWLGRLITRKVPLADFAEAVAKRDDDVKVVIELGG